MRYILSLIILLTSVSTVLAGGTFFPVKILHFNIDSKDNLSFVFKAKLLDTGKNSEVGSCEVFSVRGYYDHNRWENYNRPMSEETHRKSLEILRKAFISKETIYLGVIGNGLIKIKKCRYQSRGLFNEFYGGRQTVFSVNGRI